MTQKELNLIFAPPAQSCTVPGIFVKIRNTAYRKVYRVAGTTIRRACHTMGFALSGFALYGY